MHPILKTLAIGAATAGAMAATPASARTFVGVNFGFGGYPGYGYGYAPAYWAPPPVYWGPPAYGYYGYGPRYGYGWGHRGWHRGWGGRGWRGRHW